MLLSKFVCCLSIVILTIIALPFKTIAQDSSRNLRGADTIIVDTTTLHITPIQKPDDDFNLFLLLFGITAISFMFGCFLIGVIVFVLLILIFMAFLAAGIISTSVFVGIYKKSASKGFKTLLISVSVIAGIICGMIGFGLISFFFNLNLETQTISITGAIAGAIAGALIGLVNFIILKKTFYYLKKKLKLNI